MPRPFTLASESLSGWDVDTDPAGGTLLYAGKVVDVFPSVHAAWNWMPVAKEANAMLAAALALAPSQGGR